MAARRRVGSQSGRDYVNVDGDSASKEGENGEPNSGVADATTVWGHVERLGIDGCGEPDGLGATVGIDASVVGGGVRFVYAVA